METLPVSLSTVFLVAVGVLFLWGAHRAHRTGEIRGGSAGFRAYRPQRSESPFGFYSLQLIYVLFGSWLLIRGILTAVGAVAPLPIR